MVVFLKRTFPLVITFVVGLFMIGEFFIPHYEYRVWTASVLEWGLVLAAAAFVLGLLNIVQVNLPKVIRREKDWGYKLVLLVTLSVTLVAGFWGGADRLEDANGAYKWVYDAIFVPLGATMFALLAFFIASAAFRAFRARNLEAAILLGAAIVVMIARVPMGEDLPVVGAYLPKFMNWIMDVPNTAARRAIYIGAALGAVATGLRVIFGIERSHLGGGLVIAWLERFQNLDRRWIFLGMAIAIVVPMIVPITFAFRVDERVQALYDTVEALPAGSTVLVSADFDPTARPEIEPFFRAHLTHLFRKNVKVVIVTLWDTAPPLIAPIIEEMAQENGKTYGTDYAFLGFKPGKELAIKGIGENIYQTFPSDPRGNRVGDLPIMQGKKQAKDFDLISSVSAGFPGTKEYVLQIQAQYDLPMISSCTAVSGPDYIPYYKAHMLKGLAAGMPGAAQYEKLVFPDGPPEGKRLLATQALNVLNLGHLYIITLIVMGNVAYFLTRKRAV